ncbi:MAG: hypothetical protein AB7P52_17665 [Alphaproteobacteria bacterium]
MADEDRAMSDAAKAAEAVQKAYRPDEPRDEAAFNARVDEETKALLGELMDRLGVVAGAVVLAFPLRDDATLIRVVGMAGETAIAPSTLLSVGAEMARASSYKGGADGGGPAS